MGCWYADPAHRPAVSWCPPACTGAVTHSERAGDGELRQYCEVHAYWRRQTIRLPLVRRIPPANNSPKPRTGARRAQTTRLRTMPADPPLSRGRNRPVQPGPTLTD